MDTRKIDLLKITQNQCTQESGSGLLFRFQRAKTKFSSVGDCRSVTLSLKLLYSSQYRPTFYSYFKESFCGEYHMYQLIPLHTCDCLKNTCIYTMIYRNIYRNILFNDLAVFVLTRT